MGGGPGVDRPTATGREQLPAGARGTPHLAGRPLSDLAATAGAFVWAALAIAWWLGEAGVSTVDLFLALAVLVVVPLGMGLIAAPSRSTVWARTYRLALAAQFPAALATVVGLTQPVGSTARLVLVMPWAVLTVVLGLLGARRLWTRDRSHVGAISTDVGLLYLPVAGAFLVMHALDVTLQFSSLIVALTVVHFHYAGFALPVAVGVAAEDSAVSTWPSSRGGRALVTTAGIAGVLGGVAAIAVAITISPWWELPLVVGFVGAVFTVVGLVFVPLLPQLNRIPAALLAIASVSLVVGMALAVADAYSVFPATGVVVTIPEMVRWHGSINAFGFTLAALLALRLR